MDVKLAGLTHGIDLDTGERYCSVLIVLPDGTQFSAVVDYAVYDHLQKMSGGDRGTPNVYRSAQEDMVEDPPAPPMPVQDEPVVDETPPPSPSSAIYWSKLPDRILSQAMKDVLTALEVTEPLPPAELEEAIQVAKSLAETAASESSVGTVSWGDAPPQARRKLVPIRFPDKTEWGLPRNVTPKVRADPGEVSSELDEDGVGQM